MKIRKCNAFGCGGILRPTREFFNESKLHRIFKCPVCGIQTPWLDKPVSDNLHAISSNEISGLSLLSDPEFYPPKNPILLNRPRRNK